MPPRASTPTPWAWPRSRAMSWLRSRVSTAERSERAGLDCASPHLVHSMGFSTAAAFFALLSPLQDSTSRADAWSEDVLHVVEELERMHPDPFFAVPREEFEAAVDAFL